MKKIILTLVSVLFIFIAFNGLVIGGTTSHYDPEIDDLENNIPIIKQAGNVSTPQPVNLYLTGGEGGGLKPEMPEGNASTEVPCPGHNTPRFLGTDIGTWTSSEIKAPITADPTVTCSVWARSDEGATGVHFHLWIRVNGNDVADIWTNTQSLSGTPTEFTGDDSASDAIQLNPGDVISVQIIYFAQSRYFVGPAPDSIMIVGGSQYDTHLTFMTASLSVAVQKPTVGEQFTTVSAVVVDAFASSKYIATVRIDGIIDAETVTGPSISPGGNGTSVTWNWNHKTDGAKSGEYTITVTVSYSEDNAFTSAATYNLEFEGEKKEDGLLGGGIMDWIIPIIVIVIVVIVIVVVVKVVLGKRGEKTSETSDE